MIHLTATIPDELSGHRLDQALSILFPEHSRSRITQWIKQQHVKVNEKCLRPKDKVLGGELIVIEAPLPVEISHEAEAIQLALVYEDDELLIINKPAGLVVHPAAGNQQGTLLNALLFHCPQLSQLPRAGIVHRLDKDTTGLLVIAKTLTAHTHLVRELQEHLIKREYEAIIKGVLTSGGRVDAPIGRHPTQRTHMAVVSNGREATTHYRVLHRYAAHTHIKLELETGRTHQIRVHMAHIKHPITGDQVYGGRPFFPKACNDELKTALEKFTRQALHAVRLTLKHPTSGEMLTWEAPLPADMQHLLKLLEEHAKAQTVTRHR